MDAEQGQTKTNQDQLLEVYKLHAQLANSASNRRTATHRFYQLVLSGILLFYFTVGQHKDKILPEELSNKLTTETLTAVFGICGALLYHGYGLFPSTLTSTLFPENMKY